jgi:hypothetical protein
MLHAGSGDDVARLRGVVEVEAEGTALLVLGAHGVDTSQYSVPHVASWAASVPGDVTETVLRTFDRVSKTARSILDRLDTAQIGTGLPPGLDREKLTAQYVAKRAAAREGGRTSAVDVEAVAR